MSPAKLNVLRLLVRPSDCLSSARPSIRCISAAPTERIYVNFDISTSMKMCREIPNLAKIGQKYRTLYVKASFPFVVAGDVKLPQQRSSSEIVSACLYSQGDTHIMRTRHYVSLYVRSISYFTSERQTKFKKSYPATGLNRPMGDPVG